VLPALGWLTLCTSSGCSGSVAPGYFNGNEAELDAMLMESIDEAVNDA